MHRATFRFYANLKDFLKQYGAGGTVSYTFWGNPGIKDAIEAIGPPHPEVYLILVNGESVSFDHPLQEGDRVSVFPHFSLLEIDSLSKVKPAPIDAPRFVLDAHLGRLAGYLRMLGFDCFYHNDCADEELARLSRRERRILLTRDRGLLKRSEVEHGYCVRRDQPRKQLVELLVRYKLSALIAPFTRCMRCNQLLVDVPAGEVRDQVPKHIFLTHERYKSCPACGRVYWQGSHHARMQALISKALDDSQAREGVQAFIQDGRHPDG